MRFNPLNPFFRYLARRAADECYGVPYDSELSRIEQYGMRLLEARREAHHDLGSLESHWHMR